MAPAPSRRPSKAGEILSVNGLGVRRDGTVILHDLDWTVRKGEHWVILGANGSGKTSLLAALTGYLMPTRGDIHVLGRKFGESDWRELRRHIGWVSSSIRQLMADDEPALWTVASGFHAMIDYWGTPPLRERRAAMKWLRQVECGYLAERPWGVLSQGERQRVLIARALVGGPQILILDEPCAGLDPIAREHFLDFVCQLARRKDAPALVLVTHHVEEIRDVFTHAMALRAGAVAAQGTCAQVITSPVMTRTFGVPARVARSGGQWRLRFRR